MVKMYYGDDLDYIVKRLTHTLVQTHEKRPIWVYSVVGDSSKGISVICKDLIAGLSDQVLELHKINLEPVKLGYFFDNVRGRAVFSARKPMRRDWKQGLSTASAIFSDGRRLGDFELKAMVQPITNDYSSLPEQLNKFQKEPQIESVPLSRNFALRNTKVKQLLYRDSVVGEVQKNVAVLSSKYFFLSEQFQKEVKHAG